MKKKNIVWLGLSAAISAAVGLFLIRRRKENIEGQPPKHAPQLDIKNPGEQSEFPTSASTSEIG